MSEQTVPYLKGFRTRAEGANTIEYKIGEIFSESEASSVAAIHCEAQGRREFVDSRCKGHRQDDQ